MDKSKRNFFRGATLFAVVPTVAAASAVGLVKKKPKFMPFYEGERLTAKSLNDALLAVQGD